MKQIADSGSDAAQLGRTTRGGFEQPEQEGGCGKMLGSTPDESGGPGKNVELLRLGERIGMTA